MKQILLILISLLGVFSCTKKKGVQIEKEPFETLSEYQFFKGTLADLQPNEGVLKYELNNALFSDYAKKARFVWLPKGTTANYTTKDILDFPQGTVLIKNFYYENDERDVTKGKRILETRLLIKETKEWAAHSYIWNDAQTEANLSIVGDFKEVTWVNAKGKAMKVLYSIPNKNQCKGCHYNKGIQEPIGPKVRNLNKQVNYQNTTLNQLQKWHQLGFLNEYKKDINHPLSPPWNEANKGTLHERAMGYLDINCGHCHNPSGPANTTGLSLVSGANIGTEIGVWKASVAAGIGTGGHDFNIVPGEPEKSILHYRMAAIESAAMMPELGRSLVHEEGLALIKEWILKMEPE